jgi:hypothetical protein
MAMTEKDAVVAELLRNTLLMIGSPFSMGNIMSIHEGTLNGQTFPAILSKPLMSVPSGFAVALRSSSHHASRWRVC